MRMSRAVRSLELCRCAKLNAIYSRAHVLSITSPKRGQIGHSKGSGGTSRAALAAQKVPRVPSRVRRRRAQPSRPALAFILSMSDTRRDTLKRRKINKIFSTD